MTRVGRFGKRVPSKATEQAVMSWREKDRFKWESASPAGPARSLGRDEIARLNLKPPRFQRRGRT